MVRHECAEALGSIAKVCTVCDSLHKKIHPSTHLYKFLVHFFLQDQCLAALEKYSRDQERVVKVKCTPQIS